jgi:hypothetical protein
MPDPVVVDPKAPATEQPSPAAAPVTPPSLDWATIRTSLPDDLKGNKGLDKFKDLPSFFTSYFNMEKAYNSKMDGMVKVPKDGDTADVVSAYHKAIGVPEDPTKYEIQVPEDQQHLVPEGLLGDYKVLFHNLGIPASTAQKLVQGYAELLQGNLNRMYEGYASQINDLKTEWGKATFERRQGLAKQAIETIALGEGGLGKEWLDEFKAQIVDTPLGNSPVLFKLAAWLGEQFVEDGHIDGRMVSAPTPDALTKRKIEIESDKDFQSLENPVKHAALHKEWLEIFKQLNPERMG